MNFGCISTFEIFRIDFTTSHIFSSVAYSDMFSSNSSVYDKGLVSESICKSIVLVLSIGLSEST